MVQVKDQMSSKGEQAAAVEESSNSVVSNAISLEEAQKQFGTKPAPSSSFFFFSFAPFFSPAQQMLDSSSL